MVVIEKGVTNLDVKVGHIVPNKGNVQRWSSAPTKAISKTALPFAEIESVLTAISLMQNALECENLNDARKKLESAEIYVMKAVDEVTGRKERELERARVDTEIAKLEAQIAAKKAHELELQNQL